MKVLQGVDAEKMTIQIIETDYVEKITTDKITIIIIADSCFQEL